MAIEYGSRYDELKPGHWMCPCCNHQTPGEFVDGAVCEKCGATFWLHKTAPVYPDQYWKEHQAGKREEAQQSGSTEQETYSEHSDLAQGDYPQK